MRAIRKENNVFGLLMVEKNSEIERPLHPKMHFLLKEFSDVFPEELPLRLSPLRGDEHHINLLLSAPLPNKATYLCNP